MIVSRPIQTTGVLRRRIGSTFNVYQYFSIKCMPKRSDMMFIPWLFIIALYVNGLNPVILDF